MTKLDPPETHQFSHLYTGWDDEEPRVIRIGIKECLAAASVVGFVLMVIMMGGMGR